MSPSEEVAATVPLVARRHDFSTREIENAAIRVFASKGYDRTTVVDIASEAGISRRTFFRYFGSKEHVLRAHQDRLRRRVVRALERRPPEEPAACALCQAFLDTADVTPDGREV